MQANRYDRAAEAPIMNTYVPINFGELYRIGQAQRQAVEQAANEFTNTVSKFGEFQSPSAVDTQRYYENSLGKIRDLIDEAATNPDAMKDANFRARLNSRIANLDYATLSNLKQSREGMLARQKANQELMIKGMYNPLWHDVDFTNYNTVDSGIFNDIAPLAYKSEVDLVRPYVDNLKASFMGVKDGWIHQGVSTDRTDYEIQRNLSSIQNTPEYQKHLEVLQRQGLSRQNAEEQLNRTPLPQVENLLTIRLKEIHGGQKVPRYKLELQPPLKIILITYLILQNKFIWILDVEYTKILQI